VINKDPKRKEVDMKKILVGMLIATMMLLALSVAADVIKSTTTATSTNPSPDVTKSTTTTTISTPTTEPTNTTKSTTTTRTTPGFEATFALTGILAVAFLDLWRRC
jgi:PGF-CTERM protein